MFYDWLTIQQEHAVALPILGDLAYQRVCVDTGDVGGLMQPQYQHRGSHCDMISVRVRGSTVRMSGNPSRWGRVENLFGLPTVDACVSVFNGICRDLGLPEFTRCTQRYHRQTREDERATVVSDGAEIRELHITSNVAVGAGNEPDYISGLSTQRYRNSVPRLHSNGTTVDWLSIKGAANLVYPSVYIKAHELELHSALKIKNRFGDNSPEFSHFRRVVDYCRQAGVVRFEQKLKSRFLQKHDLTFWGLSDYSKLKPLHDEFLALDQKLQVTAMDFETISEKLQSTGVVETVRAANTTAMYAIQWMHGHDFDLNKSQVQTHRARLRKIGIDISQRCNIAKFSPVFIRSAREITPQILSVPSWYQMPVHLKVA